MGVHVVRSSGRVHMPLVTKWAGAHVPTFQFDKIAYQYFQLFVITIFLSKFKLTIKCLKYIFLIK